MKRLPPMIKHHVRDILWRRADSLGWNELNVIEKVKHYEAWAEDAEIGITLSGYMDARKVHIYIKDTLMKPYARASMSNSAPVRELLCIQDDASVRSWERPHGFILVSRRVICWGKADDWKLVLMAVHERAYLEDGQPFAAVLLPPLVRYMMPQSRAVIQSAATKLGIQQLGWHDPGGLLRE